MRLSSFAAAAAILVIRVTLASSPDSPPRLDSPSLPPQLTYLFTMKAQAVDLIDPIPNLLGGFQTLWPITGGNISGPAMTGTILHGAASLRETDDATYSANFRNIYGLTDQNASFTIEQEGVGHTTKEATWLRLNVGGVYGYLRGVFILGQNDFDFDARELELTAYGVNLNETQLGLVNSPDSEGEEY